MMTTLTVFDWNILAPIWIDLDEYRAVNGDLNLLHEGKRLLLVIERIRQSDADVITLQEVQADQYDILLSELSDTYFTSGFAHHKLSYWTSEWMQDGQQPVKNGQVTFLRRDMFEVVRQQIIQTTEDGNRVEISALKLKSKATGDISSQSLILANLHLESGMVDWKHETRRKQVRKIHSEIENMKKQLLPDVNPVTILVGDFNTYGDQPGMKEVKNNGYIDVAEMVGKETATFIVVLDERRQTLDHMVLLKSDVEAGRISVKEFHVPDLTSSKYALVDPFSDHASHKSTVIEALCRSLQRNGTTLAEALKNKEHEMDIILHIRPSSPDFTESYALKALRVGSDHLPLRIVLELK